MSAQPPRLRFPGARRLRLNREFVRVRQEGRTIRGRLFMLGLLEMEGDFRVGFVTSKRVGGAVLRNQVRRRLRDIVRRHQHEIRAGIWMVIVARAAAAEANSAALEEEWLGLCRKGEVLRIPDAISKR
jgi:ribonuclease P protein component